MPVAEAQRQQGRHRAFEVVISRGGGHNGFHGWGDDPLACWGDRLTAAWLQDRCRALPGAPGRHAAPQSR
ncbi:MAG: hypothetical protein ACPGSE_08830 [Synechococcus sp.]